MVHLKLGRKGLPSLCPPTVSSLARIKPQRPAHLAVPEASFSVLDLLANYHSCGADPTNGLQQLGYTHASSLGVQVEQLSSAAAWVSQVPGLLLQLLRQHEGPVLCTSCLPSVPKASQCIVLSKSQPRDLPSLRGSPLRTTRVRGIFPQGSKGGCGGINENVSHRFRCLNTWSPVGDAVW